MSDGPKITGEITGGAGAPAMQEAAADERWRTELAITRLRAAVAAKQDESVELLRRWLHTPTPAPISGSAPAPTFPPRGRR